MTVISLPLSLRDANRPFPDRDVQISALFLFELALILIAARSVGWAARRFLGQPQVVGEMIAGVMLGPSLLGLLAPSVQAAIFPKAAMGTLYILAQLGVGLYMFLVGLDFPLDQFRRNARSAALVSLAGMGAPFLIACAIAPLLIRVPGLFGPAVTPGTAILFIGSAMAITAFPMLARIIDERGLSGTPLGALSLAAGAIDDAGSWIVLALVLACVGQGPDAALGAILGGCLFAIGAITLGPRLLRPLGRIAEREGMVSPALMAVGVILFALAAGAMDAVGIHAVFGGFLLGAVMPRGLFAREMKRQLEPFATVVLLPFFFTYSGLNTRLGLVSTWPLLLTALGVIIAAVVAKGGACYLAARASGQTQSTALGIGALMNARGLMELILINIGLQHHVIGPALFAILALMAIVTTFMATPLFELAGSSGKPRAPPSAPHWRRLASFAVVLALGAGLIPGHGRADETPPLRSLDRLALTPPMGWNAWNRFACNVDEALIRGAADAMVASGMRDAGYRYVVIDDCWQSARGADGTIQPDPKRFPSGMKALGEYIHAKGLMFGLYSDAGVKTCAGRPGSQGHEYQDARQYAAWGVDYLKYDWCFTYTRNPQEAYTTMSDAIRATGRPIVFSLCSWGVGQPWTWGKGVGDLWRTTPDIADRWIGKETYTQGVVDIIDLNEPLYSFAGPGHWNDPDMLEVGNGGMTDVEYRSHFSLWALMAAPLMAGNDIANMSEGARAILLNREVIAVDQDPLGRQGRRVRKVGTSEVWSRPLATGDRAVILLNRGEAPAQITATWTDLGYPAQLKAKVRDVWAHKDLAPAVGDYSATVAPHGAVMVIITPV